MSPGLIIHNLLDAIRGLRPDSTSDSCDIGWYWDLSMLEHTVGVYPGSYPNVRTAREQVRQEVSRYHRSTLSAAFHCLVPCSAHWCW